MRSYDGGWAEYIRRREELAAKTRDAEPQKQKPKRETAGSVAQARPRPRQPSELERIEAEIAGREETVAELERKLADDWGDVDTLKSYRGARDELKSLLARWEELFERSQAR